MALFIYDIPAAGVPAGVKKLLPDDLAAELVRLGIGHIENKPVSAALKAEDVKSIGETVKAAKTPRKRAKNESK